MPTRPVPIFDRCHSLYQLPRWNFLFVDWLRVGDLVRRVFFRVLLGSRSRGLHELFHWNLPGLGSVEFVFSMCRGVLLRVNGAVIVRCFWVFGWNLLSFRGNFVLIVLVGALLSRDGLGLYILRVGIVQCRNGSVELYRVRCWILQQPDRANHGLLAL